MAKSGINCNFVLEKSRIMNVLLGEQLKFLQLTDSVHSAAYGGTMSIEFCHTAAVSGTMKLVFHIFSRSKFSMEHQFHCAADTGGMAYVYRPIAAVGGNGRNQINISN